MHKKAFRTKALWMFVVSYFVVLCFPLVFSQILYSRAVQVTKDNANTLSERSLTLAKENISRIFTDIQGTGREIMTRSQASSLLYATSPLSPVKLEKVGTLQDELRSKVTYSQYISEIYMYFSMPKVVASSREYMGSETAFDSLLQEQYGVSFAQLLETSGNGNDFQPLLLGTRSDKLTVVMSSFTYREQPDIICLFTLPTERFRQMLVSQASDNDYSLLWMVSPTGQVFAPNEHMLLDQGEEVNAKTLYTQYIGGNVPRDVIITGLDDFGWGWGLYSAISAQQYERPLHSIRLAYIVYLALCITLGVAISMLFSQRHYRPIRRLAQLLKVPPGEEGVEPSGNYAALETALSTLIEKEAQSNSKAQRHQRALRQAALVRILRGRISSPALFAALCKENDLFFATDQYMFIGASIRDVGRFFQTDDSQDSEQDEELLLFLVASVIEELLPETANGYAFAMDEQVFCLVSPRENAVVAEVFEADMLALCSKVGEYTAERTGISLTFYLSALHQDAEDVTMALQAAAQDVLWGMEQVDCFQLEDCVLTRKTLEKKHSALMEASGQYQGRQLRDQFVRTALSGDFDAALTLYRKLRYGGPFSFDQNFFSVQLNSALLLSRVSDEAFPHEQRGLWNESMQRWNTLLRGARDTQELETAMLSAMQDIYRHTKSAQNVEHSHATYDRVIDYINRQYADPALSVASICEHFQVSSSHLLKLFKRHGQSGVLDAIQQQRIAQAKILLRNGKETVAQIAQKVGYTNMLALIRAFKRTEGITPSEYRRLATS